MATLERHFVTYLSPGTLFYEETTQPIDSWDIEKAVACARNVKERYGATPFAFYFTTRTRGENDFDSKETARSCRYYLEGTVETIDDVRARNNPDERILLSNMENNGWNKIITNTNSWKVTQPFVDGGIILDF